MLLSLRGKLETRFIALFFLGISSGLPLLAFDSLLKARLKESGVDLSDIGYFGWVTLPYSLKLLWAPFLDYFQLPFFGRRTGWILFSQIGLLLSFLLVGGVPPEQGLLALAFLTTVGVFFSATQDIVIDGFRRESFSDKELGAASSVFVVGYRVGMILAGGVALSLAEYLSWSSVFSLLAACVALTALITLFLVKEPQFQLVEKKSLSKIIFEPFLQLLFRKEALALILFAVLYKLGDGLADAVKMPFLIELGFAKDEIGFYVKTCGLVSAIAGGLLGGALMFRLSMKSALVYFGILQMASIGGLVVLADAGKNIPLLAFVIAFENFTAGMGTAAFVAFLAQSCDRRFSAAQYAALTSLMRIPALTITTQAGVMAETLGWRNFFVVCVLAAVPGIALVAFGFEAMRPVHEERS